VGLKSVGLSGDTVQKREEVEQQTAAFPDIGRPVPDGLLAQQLGPIRHEKLHELFQVRNHRRLFDVRTTAGARIEFAIDHATITAMLPPQKLAPGRIEFEELEMELKEGTEDSLRKLAEAIQRKFDLLPSRLSKFERGLQTVGLRPTPAQVRMEVRLLEEADYVRELRSRRLGTAAPVVKLAYRCLLEQFEEMLAEEPRAWEGLDPEGVHQMRVATRRLRAAFRAFKKVLPSDSIKQFNGEFKWVAAELGKVRDLDVYQANLLHYAAEIPKEDASSLNDYRKHVAEQWRRARQDLLACLSSRRYQQLRSEFIEFLLRDPAANASHASEALSVGRAAKSYIGKQYRRVLRDGRAIAPDSAPTVFHALRIDCKRLRYLFEFFHPIYGKPLNPFIRQLKKLQDELGELQDACVATENLREYAKLVPVRNESRGDLIALGQLIHAQRLHAADRRDGFHEAWSRFDRKGRRREILAVLGAV
jgi:CHAD domain-containing protein